MNRLILTKIVHKVRLPYTILWVLLMFTFYLTLIHPWMQNWGSTLEEQQRPLPGAMLFADRPLTNTLAITIDAPPEVVWQWLIQIGQDRAGFYTYTWLENIAGADIHNTNEIRPEWQTLNVGDAWRLVPVEYLFGVGETAADPILFIEPGSTLVLDMFGSIVILPIDQSSSRLLMRGYSGPSNLLEKVLVDPIVFTLGKRMLLGLQARAEGRPDAPIILMTLAHIGWAAVVLTVAGLFVTGRQRRWWLVIPVIAALPALLAVGDVQAALAAFLAAGISILGFLFFGRRWWGSLLVIVSLVFLTLLLAPEAWTVFGLSFGVVLLTDWASAVARRSSQAEQVSPGASVSAR